jgi:hypothetical protein
MANQIDSNHAVSGGSEARNHVPIKIGPGGISMHEQYHWPSRITCFNMVDPDCSAALNIDNFRVVGWVLPFDQPFELTIIGAENFHCQHFLALSAYQ